MDMAVDLVQIRELSRQKEDENWRFRQFLKSSCNLESEQIDRRVAEITERVWAGIDCTTCANCCREVKPSFSEEEVARLARRLEMKREEFIDRYLEPSTEGAEKPWETQTRPCPFLQGNRCSVYEDRPADCSGYPYLYRPDFVFRTSAMIERIPTCPIVYEVIEGLKKSLGFSRGKGPRRKAKGQEGFR
jgi:Fe-S-cluster containining protein